MVERRCSTGSSSMIRMRSRNDVTTDDNSQLRILPRAREGVPAGGIVLLDVINALATNRTKANMNPPRAVPYITQTGAYPSLPQHRAYLSIAAFLAFGCARSPIGRNKAEGWFD